MEFVESLKEALCRYYDDLTDDQARCVAEYVIAEKGVFPSLPPEKLGPKCVCAALKRARRDAGWSQEKACWEFGIVRGTLMGYENRVPPTVTKLGVHMDAYGVHAPLLREGLKTLTRTLGRRG